MRRPASLPLLAALAVLLLALPGCLEGLSGSGRADWAYEATQIDALAEAGRTGRGVTVALLDTGIDVHHPNLDHLADHDRDNGELIAFRDFLGTAQGADQAFDDDGHGTHVAGILAASGGGGFDGIALRGGAPEVLLVVGRVCKQDSCDASTLPAAIGWAVGQGADIVSLSLGGEFGIIDALQAQAIASAVQQAVDSGTVVIASAGNRGEDSSSSDVESPADLADVIAVGAVDQDLRVARFSSRGSSSMNQCAPLSLPGVTCRQPPNQKPELVAPGVEIVSSWAGRAAGPCKGQDYCTASGTSQATPFVTAAVALLLQGRPDLPNRSAVLHLKQVLADTARALPGQAEPHDDAAGYGLVQAQAALLALG